MDADPNPDDERIARLTKLAARIKTLGGLADATHEYTGGRFTMELSGLDWMDASRLRDAVRANLAELKSEAVRELQAVAAKIASGESESLPVAEETEGAE